MDNQLLPQLSKNKSKQSDYTDVSKKSKMSRKGSVKSNREPEAGDEITRRYRHELMESNIGKYQVDKYNKVNINFLRTLVQPQRLTLQALLKGEIMEKQQTQLRTNHIPKGCLSQLMIASWCYEIYNKRGDVLYYLSELDSILLFIKEDELEKDQTASKFLQLAEMKINLENMRVEHVFHMEEVLYIRRSLINNRVKKEQSQELCADFDLTQLNELQFQSQAGQLGQTFIKKSDSINPSLRQIMHGLKLYYSLKLDEKNRRLGHLTYAAHEELVNKYGKAFYTILKLVPIQNPDQPLVMKISQTTRGGNIFLKEGLSDPDNPTTQLILWLYSWEPSFREDLNTAMIDLNSKYVEALGPIACAMFDILQSAEVRRKDRIKSGNRYHHPPSAIIHNKLGFFNSSFLVFKGCVMKTDWVMQWFHCKNLKGLRNRHNHKLMGGYEQEPAFIGLQGITSVTDSFREAMSQIQDEVEQKCHVRVLFVMSIQNYRGYAGFRLNKHEYSAHPNQRQILLREGIPMFVADIESIEFNAIPLLKILKKQIKEEDADMGHIQHEKKFWKSLNKKKIIVIHLCNFD